MAADIGAHGTPTLGTVGAAFEVGDGSVGTDGIEPNDGAEASDPGPLGGVVGGARPAVSPAAGGSVESTTSIAELPSTSTGEWWPSSRGTCHADSPVWIDDGNAEEPAAFGAVDDGETDEAVFDDECEDAFDGVLAVCDDGTAEGFAGGASEDGANAGLDAFDDGAGDELRDGPDAFDGIDGFDAPEDGSHDAFEGTSMPHAELSPFVGAAIAPTSGVRPSSLGTPHPDDPPPGGAIDGGMPVGMPATFGGGTSSPVPVGTSCGATGSFGMPGLLGTSCGLIPGDSGFESPAADANVCGCSGTGTIDDPRNSSPASCAITSAIPFGSSAGIDGAVGGGASAAVANPGDDDATLGPGAVGTVWRSLTDASKPRSSCGGR